MLFIRYSSMFNASVCHKLASKLRDLWVNSTLRSPHHTQQRLTAVCPESSATTASPLTPPTPVKIVDDAVAAGLIPRNTWGDGRGGGGIVATAQRHVSETKEMAVDFRRERQRSGPTRRESTAASTSVSRHRGPPTSPAYFALPISFCCILFMPALCRMGVCPSSHFTASACCVKVM